MLRQLRMSPLASLAGSNPIHRTFIKGMSANSPMRIKHSAQLRHQFPHLWKTKL